MRKSIKLQGQKLDYVLKTSRKARRVRLTVCCDGVLVATKPWGAADGLVENFIIRKAKWVLGKLDYLKQLGNKPPVRHSQADLANYKKEAERLVEKRVVYFSQLYGFYPKKIFIKNQKTRWGSCSKKGNLNFNYKIALLSKDVVDYIIVHELCHLKEFNHSPQFWHLVAKTVPDFLLIKKELQNHRLK
ncbi:MAG: M48 family metallopeptidase [Candidatus Pacebacteria bacterium]|nr:M48 family metallopeptidase [Candidatus Paceibacterota bacterium]